MDSMATTMTAALQVVSDPALFSLATSFQRGVPMWVVDYECMFNAGDASQSRDEQLRQTLDSTGLLPRLAIQNHDLDTLMKLLALSTQEYCQSHAKFSFASSIDDAAKVGSVEVLQWLRDCADAKYQQGTICTAAQHGKGDAMRWLLANFPDCHGEITADLMDTAASNGYLDVVHILHEWSTEGCTTRAMDDAAANGHLDVVAFLYENRIEGCTTAALDGAAHNGQLHVIEWLLMLGDARFTEEAVSGAVRNGHVEVLQCLWESSHPEDLATLRPGVSKALPSALPTMPFAMAVFLYEMAPDTFPVDALEIAKSSERDDIAEYLRAVGNFREGPVASLVLAAAQQAHESAQSLLDRQVFSVDELRAALDESMKTAATIESTDSAIFAFQIRLRQLIDQQAPIDGSSATALFLPLKTSDASDVSARPSPRKRRRSRPSTPP